MNDILYTMKTKLHRVEPGPDRRREHVVGYYEHASKIMERHFGRRPSRMSVYKYLSQGYPVARRGPYVEMPVFMALKRPMTTTEAMDRFVTLVRYLECQHGICGIDGHPD
jgi:hypothetical protein